MTSFIRSLFSFFALLLVVQFTSCKSAKDTTKQVIGTPQTPELAKSSDSNQLPNYLLWKITGNGLTQPSYLFGTIHMIGAEDFFLPDGTMTAVDDADRIVFEIDMADMSDMSSLMGIMNKAYMKDDLTLEDLLSEEDFGLVEKHFEQLGIPLFFLAADQADVFNCVCFWRYGSR